MNVRVECDYRRESDSFHVTVAAEEIGLNQEVDVPKAQFLTFLVGFLNDQTLREIVPDEIVENIKAAFEKEYHAALIWS